MKTLAGLTALAVVLISSALLTNQTRNPRQLGPNWRKLHCVHTAVHTLRPKRPAVTTPRVGGPWRGHRVTSHAA